MCVNCASSLCGVCAQPPKSSSSKQPAPAPQALKEQARSGTSSQQSKPKKEQNPLFVKRPKSWTVGTPMSKPRGALLLLAFLMHSELCSIFFPLLCLRLLFYVSDTVEAVRST